jgi:hypothetical protein
VESSLEDNDEGSLMGMDEHLYSLGENSVGVERSGKPNNHKSGDVLVAGEDVFRSVMNNFPEHFETSDHLLLLVIPF